MPPRATRRRPARSASRSRRRGPGATNVVTPIVDAMMDSVPTVFITGQVRTDLIGTDGFQETDTLGITMPVVKHSFQIRDPREIPRAIHEAFYLARSGRPGPGRRRHPAGPQPRGHRLRADHRRAPARLPADDRRQRQADPPGREGDGLRAAAGDLRRRRRRQRQRRAGADGVRDVRPLPGHVHAHGARRASRRRTRSGWACSACTARARRTTRWTRPTSSAASARASTIASPASCRSSRRTRSSSTSTSTRRRSPRTSRRTSRSSATRKNVLTQARQGVPRARRHRPVADGRVVVADREVARRPPAALRRLRRRRDQAAVHGAGALRGDRRRRDRLLGRRPAPDVGGAVLPLRQAAPVDQLRRPRDDGLRPAGGDGRAGRLPGSRPSSASPATARSR